jgi:biofilm PGA synthesis N-glycosyltransferase PgaC
MEGKSVSKKTKFSVGICAYNEEENIGKLLDAILKQKGLEDFILDEIIVVSSGSTDRTNEIVKTKQKEDPRVKLIAQRKRRGKVSAINLFLKKSKNRYLILESADTLPERDAFSKMLSVLKNHRVGMVGTRVIPIDDPKALMGFITHLVWKIHHKINLQFPGRIKVGEALAFKRIFERIPPTAILDEASIEPLIHLQGYQIVYCPKAIIFNKGPETIHDFLRQRRRNYAGHTAIRRRFGYTVVTYSLFRILGTLIANVEWSNWRFFVYTPIAMLLEAIARVVGLIDFHLKLRSHTIWKIAKSTKKIS